VERVSTVGQTASDVIRLRQFEQAARLMFVAGLGCVLLGAAFVASVEPEDFVQALVAMPLHLLIVVGVGVAATVMPFTGLGNRVRLRAGGLVLLVASALWLVTASGVFLLYMVVFRNLD
jgi:hypothetical protein